MRRMPDARTVRAWATVGVAAVAGLLSVALIAFSGGAWRLADPTPPPAADDARSRERAVSALLRHRAEAIRERDEAAFMTSVDPHATPEFRRAQRTVFHNLTELPLAAWSYELDPSDTVVSPRQGTWAPRVYLDYALEGVDVVPTRQPLRYAFTRRGDSWYLAAKLGTSVQGGRSWRAPWDFAPCRVLRTGSGLVIGHDPNRRLAERAARLLDPSTAAVTEVWGPGWSRRVGVLVPSSREEMRALAGPEFAVHGIAAVAVADRVDPTSRRVEGPRVVLNPDTAAELSDEALGVVLRHEITHVATRADTDDRAPMWMLEGFADYVAYRGTAAPPAQVAPELARAVRAAGPPTRPPQDGDFRQTGRQLDLAYQQAWSLVDFLAREIGEPKTVELYRRIAGAGPPESAERALRELTGMRTDQLVARWGAELHRRLT